MDSRGCPIELMEEGTNFTESINNVGEKAMSAPAGYKSQHAHGIAMGCFAGLNVKARTKHPDKDGIVEPNINCLDMQTVRATNQ